MHINAQYDIYGHRWSTVAVMSHDKPLEPAHPEELEHDVRVFHVDGDDSQTRLHVSSICGRMSVHYLT